MINRILFNYERIKSIKADLIIFPEIFYRSATESSFKSSMENIYEHYKFNIPISMGFYTNEKIYYSSLMLY